MSDEKQTATESENVEVDTENQNSNESSLSESPQEPNEPASENTADSETADVPSEASEASGKSFSDESNNIAPSNSTLTEAENEPKTEEKYAESEDIQADKIPLESNLESDPGLQQNADQSPAEVHTPEITPESVKAQTSTNDPLNEPTPSFNETNTENEQPEIELPKPEIRSPRTENPKVSESTANESRPMETKPKVLIPKIEPVDPETKSQPIRKAEATPPSVYAPIQFKLPQKNMSELRIKEQRAVKNRTRKRLEKIMMLFESEKEVTNDEVEKLLRVSDATATRYLKQLEQEGKIKRNGKRRGRYVSYSKI